MTKIRTVFDFNREIDEPRYADGGYPKFFLVEDGGCLSWDAAKAEARLIRDAIIGGDDRQWRVIAVAINWEDGDLYCDHTGIKIESAYGED